MNIINEITTKVVYIEYDSEKDCYLASIDKSVPVPVWDGNSIQYKKSSLVYIELATVDCSNLEVGNTITIRTIEHYPGEQIELFGGEYYTFESTGTSNIITSVSGTMTIGQFMNDRLEKYNLTDCVQEKSIDYAWVTFNKIDKSIDAMNFAKFVAECELVSIRGSKDGSITCWF